ncbi:MAG: hypothetical protein K9M07_02685 [Simkaniaceae bacterium]|nr:hypothetical protein [Simkaniaceae bacterium]MCF7852128.1 hypothetical protein [Simkaniaceae bacterium]
MAVHAFIDEFFSDLDETLDRIIENAEILEEIEEYPEEFKHEIETLKELQTSLLSHLMNLDEIKENDRIKIECNKALCEKIVRYEELNQKFLPHVAQRFKLDHDQLKLRKTRSRSKLV